MNRYLASFVALMSVSAGMAQAPGFTITGTVPGLTADHKVELVNRDERQGSEWYRLPAASVTDGKFVITGSVLMPLMCEIRIDTPEKENERSIGYAMDLMVENVPVEINAVHVDSLPHSFTVGTIGIDHRKYYTVKAGEAQREFEEYRAELEPYERASRQAHYNLYWDQNRDKSEAGTERLRQAYSVAEGELSRANDAFIRKHPAYHISAMEWYRQLSEPFVFTAEELDELQPQLNANNSPERVALINAAIDKARQVVRGQKYTDFVAKDAEGAEHSMSEYVGKGRWTMIDFWASWCGPCRAAIPHVRELHKKYGDRLGIYAVSLDEEDAAWRNAMELEKMDWTQLQLPKENFGNVSRDYNFKAIPFMVLIDPDGHIAFAGHDPGKVSEILAKGIGQ
ncbi:MAG: AhpC/TSA family protein [Duncaniella sp.]|nr:AhpC/TSA family protein [Duncaniella sp.]